jgi:hypothetical protein
MAATALSNALMTLLCAFRPSIPHLTTPFPPLPHLSLTYRQFVLDTFEGLLELTVHKATDLPGENVSRAVDLAPPPPSPSIPRTSSQGKKTCHAAWGAASPGCSCLGDFESQCSSTLSHPQQLYQLHVHLK